MQTVGFEYDLFKDGWNIFRVFTQPPLFDVDDKKRPLKGLEKELIHRMGDGADPLIKQQIIVEYLLQFISKNKDWIYKKINSFQRDWQKINNKYFEKLAEILNIRIPTKKYTVYLTNAGRCPFNAWENWLMVRIFDEKVDMIVAHEIMHIEFINAYSIYCKDAGLSPKQFDDLRESLTVLLNEEMKDILSRPDYGYKEHQNLRNQIIQLWRKNKNFKNLLDNTIKILK